MKTLTVFIVLGTLLFQSCGPSDKELRLRAENERLKAEQAKPKPKTRMDGAWYFYSNFDEFKINLGGSYGSHRIKSVSVDGNYMVVKYAFKNGVLRGNIEPNGSYSGTYRTSSTSGDFDLRFETDGTAYGSWNSTSSFLSFSGTLSFEK